MSTRQDRLGELIRQEVSSILRARVSDPRIGFVSLTKVKISPDLADASIYVSIYGDEQTKRDSLAGLASATNFIRGELGERIEFRLVPQLRFIRDDSLEKGSQVINLINKLKTNDKNSRTNKRAPKKK
ncbi:ribosome-binding factor A [candidate division WOR-1 bacterium RIFOXYB2_FULL_48_7]|uniref:Ribosome-binding factor A n=1 Tax=candidate division WOR-1 bacterium RIFOXYB2_FULL_48_7 TaxID=1802583 RepID=A0A1F4TSZ2_UNCSA|nr:MAG: ribosome-binding factor A [candidate division WOR-1 bacterium RIFOXYB2_FULL_48_7]